MLYINWCFWALNLGKDIQGPSFQQQHSLNKHLLKTLPPFSTFSAPYFSYFSRKPFHCSFTHQPSTCCCPFVPPPLSALFTYPSAREKRQQVTVAALSPHIANCPAPSASKPEFSFCFFSMTDSPRSLLITSRNKMSGSLEAKMSLHLFIFFTVQSQT